MKDPDRKYKDLYRNSQNSTRDKSDKVRRIRSITLTVFALEFALIAVGILIFGLKQNFILMVIAVGIFILTVILGANEKELRCAYVKLAVKYSKRKEKAFARIIDNKIISGNIVNGELTKVIMQFRFKIGGKRYIGFKILKVKKLRKGKDFKDDGAYEQRLTSFSEELDENGSGLNVLYVEGKKYCYICDSSDYVFNYFITDVLFAENKAKKFN